MLDDQHSEKKGEMLAEKAASDDSLMPAYLVTLETPFTAYSRYVICYVSTSNKHFISAVNDLHPWVFYAFSRPLGELVHNCQAREYWPEAGRVKRDRSGIRESAPADSPAD